MGINWEGRRSPPSPVYDDKDDDDKDDDRDDDRDDDGAELFGDFQSKRFRTTVLGSSGSFSFVGDNEGGGGAAAAAAWFLLPIPNGGDILADSVRFLAVFLPWLLWFLLNSAETALVGLPIGSCALIFGRCCTEDGWKYRRRVRMVALGVWIQSGDFFIFPFSAQSPTDPRVVK